MHASWMNDFLEQVACFHRTEIDCDDVLPLQWDIFCFI